MHMRQSINAPQLVPTYVHIQAFSCVQCFTRFYHCEDGR